MFWDNTGDNTMFSYRCGPFRWCGSNNPNDGNTDWNDTQFSIYHLNHTQSTTVGYSLQGALYLKSDAGYPISIGNDTGDIQL